MEFGISDSGIGIRPLITALVHVTTVPPQTGVSLAPTSLVLSWRCLPQPTQRWTLSEPPPPQVPSFVTPVFIPVEQDGYRGMRIHRGVTEQNLRARGKRRRVRGCLRQASRLPAAFCTAFSIEVGVASRVSGATWNLCVSEVEETGFSVPSLCFFILLAFLNATPSSSL